MTTQPLSWWASYDREHYRVGPHPTREACISAADREMDRPYWITQAAQDPVQLSEYIDFYDMVARAEEKASEDFALDDDPIFHYSSIDLEMLEKVVKRAIDEWQESRGLRFIPYTFTRSKCPERVEGTLAQIAEKERVRVMNTYTRHRDCAAWALEDIWNKCRADLRRHCVELRSPLRSENDR